MTREFVDVTDKKHEAGPSVSPQTLLAWLAIEWPPTFTRSRGLGSLIGAGLTLAIPALFLLALVAAFAVLGKTILDVFTDGGSGPSLGVGAMITALLGVPFVIWGTVIRQKALEFQKEGHITDRISAAVEQLGAEKVVKVPTDEGTTAEESKPNIEVRIGGLLSLERIAQDSTRYDQGRDHVRVMAIICAYIRENAPASEAVEFPLAEWEPLKDNPTKEEREAHEMWRKTRFGDGWSSSNAVEWASSNAGEWAGSLKPPRADIQTALDVLKRRTPDQRKVEANWPNVGPAPQGWVFDEVTFQRLQDVPSEKALTKAELDVFEAEFRAWRSKMNEYTGYRLDLRKTNLQRADLSNTGSDAVFSGALLTGARMEGARLVQARIEGSDLSRARMEGAALTNARMEGARLFEARLEGASLIKVRMEGAILKFTRMEGTDLSEARMEGAQACGVRFGENTSFFEATFQGARWNNVDLCATDLTQDQIDASFGDGSVTLPDGLNRPAHWPVGGFGMSSYDKAYDNWLKTRAP